MTGQNLSQLAVFLPLMGFLLTGIGGKYLGDRLAQWVTCALMLGSALASCLLFKKVVTEHQAFTLTFLSWIHIGDFQANWGAKIDTLSSLMLCVVTLVSFLVHVYSVGYMSQDKSIPRFMAYLSLFTFAMLMLVTAPNFIQLFFGWEGVGLASYLLIGFWYDRTSANAAAMKAFIVNRIGDVGLALGIATIFAVFHTVDIEQFLQALRLIQEGGGHPSFLFWGHECDGLTLIGILLFIGAMGKSAQLGLHTWLPDAMEGPTPVSALIHAATMVTAGVFLVARLSFLYEMAPMARNVIIFVGAITAFFAASVALTQTDIKRVIAYSTCSQLGYMFFAAGCSGYNAAMFHLVTHAFFKALLFLGAGSIIHAMSDEQDMTRMGGIYKLIPKTYAFMWVGSLALAGVPYFAGYYSKDAILETAFLKGTNLSQFAFILGLIVAFLTAFYSWRLLLLAFHGKPQADDRVMAHVHESPRTMLFPLAILSLGAIFSGYFTHDWFIGKDMTSFWNGAIALPAHPLADIPFIILIAPLLCASAGIVLAYLMYGGRRQMVNTLSNVLSPLYLFSKNKWYFDELYKHVFVQKLLRLGVLFWQIGDKKIIDGIGPDGITKASLKLASFTSRLQTGYVYHYAFAMIAGILVMMTWYLRNEFWG